MLQNLFGRRNRAGETTWLRKLFGRVEPAADLEEHELQERPRPTATLRLHGSQSDKKLKKSFASLEAEAKLTDVRQKVVYEIKWTANAAPAGNHLGQEPGKASDEKPEDAIDGWVLDRNQKKIPIGQRAQKDCHYFNENDDALVNSVQNGLRFFFRDGIEQPLIPDGGKWWFRLRVVDATGEELACSDVVEIAWAAAVL